MTTPGSLKRNLDGVWKREGSFMLYVATAVDLPPAPDENGIYAWVDGEQKLYHSYAGVWVPPATVSGPTYTEYIGPAQCFSNGAWISGYNASTSVIQAVKVNNLIHLYVQAIATTTFLANINTQIGNLVPALRTPNVKQLPTAAFYKDAGTAVYPGRVQMNVNGDVQILGAAIAAGYTQCWIDSTYLAV